MNWKIYLKESLDIFQKLSSDEITSNISDLLIQFLALESGNSLLVCGNGGSASDAMHITGELAEDF